MKDTTTSTEFSLEVIQIASPCHMAWEDLSGGDRVRHCSECDLNVYNLSDLTRDEAEQLVLQHEGRMCVHLYRRTDGTVLTKDCPVGLAVVRHRLARSLAAMVALFAALLGGTAFGMSRNDVSSTGPFQRLFQWIDPYQGIAGGICAPPPPAVPPVAVPPPAAPPAP